MILTDYLLRQSYRGDALALADSDYSLSYDALSLEVKKAATQLSGLGLQKGDVVALYSQNCVAAQVVFYATALLGGIVSPVNPAYGAKELRYQVSHANARFLWVGAGLEGNVKDIPDTQCLHLTPSAWRGVEIQPDVVPVVGVSALDPVFLPYSSGTSGWPKGVLFNHRAMIGHAHQAQEYGPVKSGEILIGNASMSTVYGQMLMTQCLANGASMILMPRFDLSQYLKLLEIHKVNRAQLVPAVVARLANDDRHKAFDLSHLKIVEAGSAPLAKAVREKFEKGFGCVLKQDYGMTEIGPICRNLDHNPVPESVGRLVRPLECQLRALQNYQPFMGAGKAGELWIRSPYCMLGYYNDSEATKAVMDEQGWLNTGDIAYINDDGYFFLVGRTKEVIKCNGYSVAPAELEALLLSHQGVCDAAVVAAPDPQRGEIPVAFVVLRQEGLVEAEELKAFVSAQVAPYKKIRGIKFVQQIPRSPQGKTLKRLLIPDVRKAP